EVTRSLSRNLYKSSWVVVSNDEKCIIDSNARMESRIEELEALRQSRLTAPVGYGEEDEDGEPEFVSGLGGEEIDALLADHAEGAEGAIIKAHVQDKGPDLEEIKAQAQEMIDDAQAQIDEMREAAEQEIEMQRRQAIEEGNRQGYDMGHQQAMAEMEDMRQALLAEKQQLEEEYDRMIENLEPRFIDTITEVYSHIFGIELAENRDILVHLIDATLRRVESSRTFIVHVSKEDYPFVNMQKQELTERATAGKGMVEIIEDIALGQGACLIETDGGIFDCGIDTQLQALTNKLRVLSFEKSND
ncbi:MAG: hypothetical protein K2N77_02275, partial [Lachnospiraceae bacterium]|nr:hypothetical protein [Lachnospiraceae bacterium]